MYSLYKTELRLNCRCSVAFRCDWTGVPLTTLRCVPVCCYFSQTQGSRWYIGARLQVLRRDERSYWVVRIEWPGMLNIAVINVDVHVAH